MFRIKKKMDYANNLHYYVIQKKVWLFWVNIFEYGDYSYANKVLTNLVGEGAL